MAGESEQEPGFKSPGELAVERMADTGLPHAKLAHTLYSKFSAPSGVGSGKFEFSIEEMKQLHKEFKAERDAFDRIRERNENFVQGRLRPMAKDAASEMHYEKAYEHYGRVFQGAISRQRDYCDAYCYAIERAILVKQHGEEEAARMMNEQGKGLDQ